MKTTSQKSNAAEVEKIAASCSAKAVEPRKLRPRRPIGIAPGNLPDDALVEKGTRRALTGLGDSQTYNLIQRGLFPAPIRLGARCVRWRMGDLRRWLVDPNGFRAA